MKDIIEKILAYLPHYFVELGQVCAGPKRFIAGRDVNSEEIFAASLVFLAISMVLGILIQTPFNPPNKDLWIGFGWTAVETMFDVTSGALAVYFGWWIVGGRARPRGFFTSYSYFSGASYVIFPVFSLVALSIVKVLEPERFEKISQRRPGSEQFKMMVDPVFSASVIGEPSTTLYVAYAIVWAAILLWLVWFIVAWGAFRTLSGRSKIRSFFAFLLAFVFFYIGSIAFYFIDLASD